MQKLISFKNIYQQFLVLTFLTLSSFSCEKAHTKEKKDIDERLYLIEFSVFRYLSSHDAGEQWDQQPILNYPEQLLFLSDSSGYLAREIYPHCKDVQLIALQEPEPEIIKSLTTGEDYLENNNESDNQENNLSKKEKMPFMMIKTASLDPNKKTLLNKVSQLRNHPNYEVLFYQNWYQSLASLKNEIAIAINGGNNFQNRYSLQGFITIAKGRFVRVSTNLWLSEFLANDYDSMIFRPWYESEPSYVNLPNSPCPIEEQDLDTNNQNDSMIGLSEYYFPQKSKQYHAESTYILKQIQRIDSDDFYYFDHPKFGALVKITKYKPETN